MNRPLYPEEKKGLTASLIGFIIAVMAIAIMMTGAGCCKKTYPVAGVTVHDTVTVTKTVKERDTVLMVPGANVSIDVPHNDTIAQREKRNKQAHLKITKTDKGLHVDCDCDTASIKAKLYDTYQQEHRQTETEKTIVVKEKYVPWIVKTLAWIGGIALLIFVVAIVKKIWF